MSVKPCSFSAEVNLAQEAALEAGEILLRQERRESESANLIKEDDVEKHHAIVTEADEASQKHILAEISARFPDASVIAEEKSDKAMIITDSDLERVYRGRVYLVDPLDGTTMHHKRLFQYSVSVGAMLDGGHIGGAIYLPAVERLLVYGERGKGVLMDRSYKTEECAIASWTEPKRLVINIGQDMPYKPQFTRFMYEVGRSVRAINTTGSCAFSLAMLAAGRLDAVVQPVQGPWDWAAGYPLVVEAGGKFQFYHYREGEIVALDKPDLPSYSPTVRNVGFVAGVPEAVDWIFGELKKYWMKPVIPTDLLQK